MHGREKTGEIGYFETAPFQFQICSTSLFFPPETANSFSMVVVVVVNIHQREFFENVQVE